MTIKNLNDDKNSSIAADFVSGAAAGFFSGAIIAPTEYAKVLLQTMPNSQWRTALTNPE